MARFSSRTAALFLLGATALALPGCGHEGAPPPPPEATLVLDFAPNAVHAGTYLAAAGPGGVRLRIRAPSGSTDALKLLRSGRADLAYLDIHDLALADERAPGSLVGVMALVQRPLAAVLAAGDVQRPRALEGRRVGVTGLPSDRAVLDSVVRGDGGDPARVRRTTIGFQAVPALLGGRVAGATAFWNAEGVALRARRPSTRIFRVDDFGAPSYPELVLATTPAVLRERPGVVGAVVAQLRRGYRETIDDPARGLAALERGAPGVDGATARRELAAVLPAFTTPDGAFGTLDPERLRAWAAWEHRSGITHGTPDVTRLFTTRVPEPR